MTNTEFHGQEAKRARRAKRIANRRQCAPAPIRRSAYTTPAPATDNFAAIRALEEHRAMPEAAAHVEFIGANPYQHGARYFEKFRTTQKIPPPPAEPFKVESLPAPEWAFPDKGAAPGTIAVNIHQENPPPAIIDDSPVFGCAFPRCGRTFKTAAGVRGHQRAHKSNAARTAE